MTPNQLGGLVIAFGPLIYNIAMHKAGLHAVDFDPKWLFAFFALGACVSFWKELRKLANDMHIKLFGLEVEDKK